MKVIIESSAWLDRLLKVIESSAWVDRLLKGLFAKPACHKLSLLAARLHVDLPIPSSTGQVLRICCFLAGCLNWRSWR